jgi:hypothetical protein
MMKSVRDHLHLVLGGMLLLAAVVTALCMAYELPIPFRKQPAAPGAYLCPMHPEVHGDSAGNCPKCGMKLVSAKAAASGHAGCGKDHPTCCADKTKASVKLELPPGHPPIPGYTVAAGPPMTRPSSESQGPGAAASPMRP